MPMSAAVCVPDIAAKTLVCMNKGFPDEFSGVLYNPCIAFPVPFNGVVNLLVILEKYFNRIYFPQACFADRSFLTKKGVRVPAREREVQRYMEKEEFDELASKNQVDKVNFLIQVQFRQNSTWQGTITWIDRKKKRHFRSVLEMIKLMMEAMPSEQYSLDWVE